MDIQQAFDFEHGEKRNAALRQALLPYRLAKWTVELIVLFAADGTPKTIAGQRCLQLDVSKRNAASAMGCASNTFVKAVTDLQLRGVLEIVAFGQQRSYFLSRDRVDELAPVDDDPVDTLGLFSTPAGADQSPNRSALVSAGQRARVRVRDLYISRVPCREPCRDRGPADQPSAPSPRPTDLTTAPPPLQQPAGRGRHANDPGGRGGGLMLRDLTDDDVRAMEIPRLKAGFIDAVRQGWMAEELEDKRKFLAACHHAATAKSIHYPARVVYAAIKNYDFERVPQASWNWAGRFLRDHTREENDVDHNTQEAASR